MYNQRFWKQQKRSKCPTMSSTDTSQTNPQVRIFVQERMPALYIDNVFKKWSYEGNVLSSSFVLVLNAVGQKSI